MKREERKAPQGKFRVIWVDTFDHEDGLEGDYDSLDSAKDIVDTKTKGVQMLKMHVYDDTGAHRYEGGSF